jgi:uncharacterized tellurite resistance protein B-like protein
MAFKDLYWNSEHRSNLAHFAAIASLAAIDGEVGKEEKAMLDRFAFRLDITEEEYKEVMKKENKYPIEPSLDSKKRLERLYDLFSIIFVDHPIEENELALLKRYAIGLGYPNDQANKIIKKSVAIFSGKFDFEDYKNILKL